MDLIATHAENGPLAKATWLGRIAGHFTGRVSDAGALRRAMVWGRTATRGRRALWPGCQSALVFLTFVALAVVAASPASAAISVSGDVSPVYPGGSPWNVTDLDVGFFSGVGSLHVTAGSEINSDSAAIGGFAYGEVDITGSGSSWTNTGSINVAKGLLQIQFGATVVTESLLLPNISAVHVSGNSATLTISDPLGIAGSAVTLHVGSGGVVNANGGVGFTAGSLTLDGGTLNTTSLNLELPSTLFPTGTGNINLTEPMVIGGSNKTTTIGAGLNVDVTDDPVTVSSGSTLIVDGSLSSTQLNNDGTLVLLTTTLDQPVVNPDGSVMNLIGSVVFNDEVSGAGGIFGSGTATFNGGYSPGDSPAVVELENNVVLGATNELSIELQGKLAGEFDQLDIGGDATLDGLLDVSLLGGFEPQAGDEFLFLDIAGNRTGEFAGLAEGDVVGNFAGVDLMITYAAGNGNDVALFAAAGSTGNAGVPEPSSLLLLSLGALGLSRTRRRRQQT